MNKSTQIKNIVAKIDIDKITAYREDYPKSKTLKEIIRYSKIVSDIDEEKAVFKLGVKIAYNLEKICDPEKVGCAKNEQEKKHWLKISHELFENTIGVKEIKEES